MPACKTLLEAVELRKQQNLYRQRIVTESGSGSAAICFGNNDYLGLAKHPQVVAALQQAATTYGVGSTASPLIVGYKKIHQQLEEEFAAFVGMERALLFSSGYLANLGAITAAVGRGDLVYQDKENHASLIDAVILARAKTLRYRDLTGLQQQLAKPTQIMPKLIVTESVFSMSGREQDLEQLLGISGAADAWLLVDEAHGIGVLGENGAGALVAALAKIKMDPKSRSLPEEIILTAPLGKAFGCAGGIVAGSNAYIEHCLQQARSYIYSTGIAPSLAAANLASLQVMQAEPWHRQQLLDRIQQFKTGAAALGLVLLPSNTPIQWLSIGDEANAVQVSEQLLTRKILVRAMRYPTVPRGKAGLRISITAAHSESEINYLLEQLHSCLGGADF